MLLLLAGCAGSGDRTSTLRQGLTNVTNEDGIPYVTNGDEFADAQAKLPTASDSKLTKKIVKDSLGDRIRGYEFTRWDDKTKSKKEDAKRFGLDHWEFKVFFRKNRTVKMTGSFGKSATGETTLVQSERALRYQLEGAVLKDESKPYEKTRFHGTLRDSRKKESVVVSYYAYLGKLDVRDDSANKPAPGSTLECQLKALHENTLAWVNNWTTIPGRVFFFNDLVRTIDPKDAAQDCLPSSITFRGESLATSSEPSANVNPDAPAKAESLYAHDVESNVGDVSLIGNPAQGNRRMFVVPLEDKQSAQTNDVVVTITALDAADQDAAMPDGYDENGNPIDDPAPTPGKEPAKSRPAPSARPAARPALVVPTARPGDAFLSNVAGAQAARQTQNFERNRNLRGVRDFVDQYRGRSKSKLQAFYDNAAPFVPMMQKISQKFDVIGWAYLTVVESAYFTQSGYQARIRGDGNASRGFKAWGPFQMHEAAARQSQVRVTNSVPSDERDYFAPAACGAAQYVAAQVRQYPNDATIAILAYNQGPGGAGAAIYCSYHSEQEGHRQECNRKVNKEFSNSQYSRFSRLANNYSYTYAEMANFGVLTPNMTAYVNNKLALYFISQNPAAYGFSSANAKRTLPTNGTVMPPGGVVSNPACQSAIAGTY